MYTCTVDGPTLTAQEMTFTPTTAGSTETPSRITPSTRSVTSSSTSGTYCSTQSSGTERHGKYAPCCEIELHLRLKIHRHSSTLHYRYFTLLCSHDCPLMQYTQSSSHSSISELYQVRIVETLHHMSRASW